MSDELIARGWPAEWLNGWMAALGVLSSVESRMSFSVEPVPKPVFTRTNGLPFSAEQVAVSLPSVDDLHDLDIARPPTESRLEFPRKPTTEQYHSRAAIARRTENLFLGSTVTDLVGDGNELPHSPFDATVPKGLTLWERVVACVSKIDNPQSDVATSMEGRLPRVKLNGLGFDARRIAVSTATDNEKYIDPVVELLAFLSLPMFPVRGSGQKIATTRGWKGTQSRRWAFTWPVWREPLTSEGVDVLLGEFWNSRPDRLDESSIKRWQSDVKALGIFGCYGSIAYRPTGTSDTTRAYSAEELWMTN